MATDKNTLPPPRAESACVKCGHRQGGSYFTGPCVNVGCKCKCVFPEPNKGEQPPARVWVDSNRQVTGCLSVGERSEYPSGGYEGTEYVRADLVSGVTQQSVASQLARQAAEKDDTEQKPEDQKLG